MSFIHARKRERRTVKDDKKEKARLDFDDTRGSRIDLTRKSNASLSYLY